MEASTPNAKRQKRNETVNRLEISSIGFFEQTDRDNEILFDSIYSIKDNDISTDSVFVSILSESTVISEEEEGDNEKGT